MAEWFNSLVYGYYPYIVLSVFILGCWARYDYSQYTWRSGSSQLLYRRQLMIGSNLFHLGILVLFFGHFVGLLTPLSLLAALHIGHEFKQIMAMVVGGVAGFFAFIGLTLLVHRRLFIPRIRKTSSTSDILILLVLYAQLILGLFTLPLSGQHLDGSEMVKFMHWAQGIVTFQPDAASYVFEAPWIFKLHLFLGMTIFLVFPFTRLVHVWSVPIWYLMRPGYQIVRTKLRGSHP